jgi:hypothetical protein
MTIMTSPLLSCINNEKRAFFPNYIDDDELYAFSFCYNLAIITTLTNTQLLASLDQMILSVRMALHHSLYLPFLMVTVTRRR